MSKFQSYFWFFVVVVYLIVPWDLYPGLLDDVIVFGLYLLFLFRQMNKIKAARDAHYRSKRRERHGHFQAEEEEPDEPLTLQKAYRLLGVSPAASREEIRRAFHKQISENHPDKVSHLSRALRDKANELTVKINRAYNLIKKHKNM